MTSKSPVGMTQGSLGLFMADSLGVSHKGQSTGMVKATFEPNEEDAQDHSNKEANRSMAKAFSMMVMAMKDQDGNVKLPSKLVAEATEKKKKGVCIYPGCAARGTSKKGFCKKHKPTIGNQTNLSTQEKDKLHAQHKERKEARRRSQQVREQKREEKLKAKKKEEKKQHKAASPLASPISNEDWEVELSSSAYESSSDDEKGKSPAELETPVYSCSLTKPMGVKLQKPEPIVSEVMEGTGGACEWNKKNPKNLHVREGDRIVAVEVKGEWKDMFTATSADVAVLLKDTPNPVSLRLLRGQVVSKGQPSPTQTLSKLDKSARSGKESSKESPKPKGVFSLFSRSKKEDGSSSGSSSRSNSLKKKTAKKEKGTLTPSVKSDKLSSSNTGERTTSSSQLNAHLSLAEQKGCKVGQSTFQGQTAPGPFLNNDYTCRKCGQLAADHRDDKAESASPTTPPQAQPPPVSMLGGQSGWDAYRAAKADRSHRDSDSD